MQQIINNGNIGTFVTNVTFDIYSRQMVFDTSESTYNNSPSGNGCEIAFSVQDQNGVYLSEINFDNPQIPDAATEQSYTLDLSFLSYQFLFVKYQIVAAIKDTSTGNIYYLTFPVKQICIPTDFTDYGYVPGTFIVTVDCTNSVLTVKDATVFVYNNSTATEKTTDGTLYYPLGTIDPISFSGTPFSNDIVYTGTYKIANTSTGTYDLGDGFFVIVTYVTDAEWYFNCEKKMVDVMCCWVDTQRAYEANCDNAKGARYKQQLDQASLYMLSGLIKEASGSDASDDADAVKKILNCNCGRGSIKHIQPDPVNPTIYNIVINGTGGTTATAVTVGNTKTYTINSKTYVTGKGNPSDLAFTIAIDTATLNTVKYLITFNYSTMANYILTAIGADSSLLTQFNALVSATANIDISTLNGKCIIDLSSLNYFLSYRVPSAANTVTNIIINSVTYNAPASLLVSDFNGIQAWLNGLGLGTFKVSFSTSNSAYYINVLTNNNSNSPQSMTFLTTSSVTVAFQRTNKSLIAFLQAVVDYLCEITGLQVYLGQALSLCDLDYNDDIVTTSYSETDTVTNFLSGVATTICNIITRIQDATSVTCDKLKNIFTSNPSGVFGANDLFFGTLGGNCFGISMSQAAMAIINAINADATVKAAFCAIDCSSPASCPDVGNVNAAALSSTSIGLYGVTWTPANPSATQTVTVKYRVTGTTSWTTATNSLQLFANGNVVVSSPYTISGLSAATQYDIFVQNNCGGVGFIKQVTTPTGTVYATSVLLDTDIYNLCGDTPANVYSNAPLTTGVIAYTDIGLTTPVTGYDYIAIVSSGEIFTIDNATGEILTDTSSQCGAGTAGTYILGNDTGTICSGSDVTLYTDGAFAVLGYLYNDSGLTSPVTGYAYVVNTSNNHIYNVDNVTGQILSDTGLTCSSATVRLTSSIGGANITGVTGISGFTPTPSFPLAAGGTITGTHASFTGAINFTMSGSLPINPCNATLYINGVLTQKININAIGSYSFSSNTYLSSETILISWGLGS